ncbi:iron-containing alcohol dehydrogenase [Siminovitchia sediminis]|uniref:Iron-containing alcohol dehydrogenase n=1 Tax=Siminovitchia sediminis TaxID=1274353 RepID=A0ABW4KKG8_9BACI
MSAHRNTVFNAKTKLISGIGSIKSLSQELKKIQASTILVVTDKGIKNAGILNKVLEEIDSNYDVMIFDEVKPNPEVEMTDNAYHTYKDKGIDLLLAIGGGSVLDTAKGLSVLFSNGGSIADYYGYDIYKNKTYPMFAVPTTVGTGSESGNAAVFTDNSNNLKTKKLIFGEDLFPEVAFLDAELLKNMPSHLISSTGMDALTHAIEGYVANWSSHVTDSLNLHAVRVIGSSIRQATAHSENLEAMHSMLLASTIAGLGMANSGLGMVHGISHAIGAQYDAPHGIVNAILLPYLLEYNWIANPEKFSHIADALRVNIQGLSVEDAAKAAVEHVKTMTAEVGIPDNLSAIGVDDSKIDLLTDIAFNDQQYMVPNPRKMSRQDIYDILQKAIAGSAHPTAVKEVYS